MLDQIAAAFERQDYKTAAKLLKALQAQSPDNAWIPFYRGRLQEAAGKLDEATAIYRRLLKENMNPKIASQVRQALQRLETIAKTEAKSQRQAAITQAMAAPENSVTGVLVLEPIEATLKQTAAQQFARIMQLDPYTARMILPSRGWRLYRVGSIGTLQVYGQELVTAGVPAFWVALPAIESVQVFQVQYVQAIEPHMTIVCQNQAGQMGSISFRNAEVTNRVEGLLPIYESVVDLGAYNKLKRKEQTQDYVKVIDLHLGQRNCILRFCDRLYQFQQGLVFAAQEDGLTKTTRQRWNELENVLKAQLATVNLPAWPDFSTFAPTALEQFDFLTDFKANLDLFRKEPSHWDQAFQLYSGLVFVRSGLSRRF